jgi:pyruvate,orthophosphate dikinase
MSASKSDKIHILVMDDSLGSFMRMSGIKPERLLDGTGLNVEVEFAETKEAAEAILYDWAAHGIKPDIVSTDVLYGHHGHPAIQELSYIMEDVYKDKPELKPTKIFVHSKSGIEEGDEAYAIARACMKELDAEYVHTDELLILGDTFGSDRETYQRWSPTTNTLRKYLHDTFGVEIETLTRDEIEANKRRQEAERVGDNIHPAGAINAVDDGGITPDVALMKMSPELARQSLEPELHNRTEAGGNIDYHPVRFKKATGGAANGVAAFTADEVRQYKAEGKKVILVLENFTPADVGLLSQVDGVVLLGRGSSHLPILCENHGIAGVFSENGPEWGNRDTKLLSIEQDDSGYKLISTYPSEQDTERRKLYEFTIRSGDPVSIETQHYKTFESDEQLAEGKFYRQEIPLKEPEFIWWLDKPMQWAREQSTQEWHRRGNHQCHGLGIKGNADSAQQVKAAFAMGAQGIGLLRTEHMMMQGEQLHQLQSYMFAEDDAVKEAALAQLKVAQKREFAAIYAEVKAAEARNYEHDTSPLGLTNLLSLPVTMRLFDAKLDEILPSPDSVADIARLAADTGMSEPAVREKLEKMIETNERGVQFGLKHQELYKAQIEALFEAAKEIDAKGETHHTIVPEIMVPMVKTPEELVAVKELVAQVAEKNGFKHKENAPAYRFGSMIETKEAVINAAELAKQSDFFSFGTNDLTQDITGLRRDDIEAVDKWMNDNATQNPYKTLCEDVKTQMQRTASDGLKANPMLKINVCGHQVAYDKPSIAFCQSQNFNAISVPSNMASQVTSSIIAGQEAYRSHEADKANNKAWREAGGKTLLDVGRAPAISPESLAEKRQTGRGWVQE